MSNHSYVVAVDQGTTSTRCVVVDEDGAVVSSGQLEHRQILPAAGWVEHDPQAARRRRFRRGPDDIRGNLVVDGQHRSFRSGRDRADRVAHRRLVPAIVRVGRQHDALLAVRRDGDHGNGGGGPRGGRDVAQVDAGPAERRQGLLAQVVQPAAGALAELGVARVERLVDHEDVRVHRGGDRELQARGHARGIRLERQLERVVVEAGQGDDGVPLGLRLRAGHPHRQAAQTDVVLTGDLAHERGVDAQHHGCFVSQDTARARGELAGDDLGER